MAALVLLEILVYSCKEQIVGLFTADQAVFELANASVFIICLAFIPDMIQGSIQGVIRALGIQRIASCYSLASYYVLGIPCSIVFTFVLDWGVVGLWAGILVGIASAAIIFVRLTLKTDWQ